MSDHLSPRIALIGCGRWGENILRDLLSLGCEVVVSDSSDERRTKALNCGASAVFREPDEAAANARGAVIATPAGTHAEVIESLLPLAIPLFCEKPLTTDSASARRLAESAGGRLFVMHKWRYHPGVEMLASIATSGELGDALTLRTSRLQTSPVQEDADAAWTLAPHDLSIALAILGSIPPVHSAWVTRRHGRVETLLAVFGRRPRLVLEVSTAAPVLRREIWLECEGGVASLQSPQAPSVEVRPWKGPAVSRPVSGEQPLLRELREFVDHVRGGPPPRCSAMEGAEVVAAIEDVLVAADDRP